MKPIKSAVAALVLASTAGVAFAQTTVVIKPEQETVIREYVKKKPLASISVPGISLSIGATLPETVELHAVEVPDVSYRYVVVDDKTVLVDPSTRKVVHIIN